MNHYPSLSLRKDLSVALREGHPWVYRDALTTAPDLATGTVVDLKDERGAFLARGLYDRDSPIALRIYTLDPKEAIDEGLLKRRLRAAWSGRAILAREGTNAYRLCNGEGDFLPGIVIDRYADIAALRLEGPTRLLAPAIYPILTSLAELFPIPVRTLYERSPQKPALLLGGEPLADSGEVIVQEYDVKLVVNVLLGQKTGLFLDMRDNRFRLRRYAKDRTVWNGFCYTGGFSVHAALSGARHVVSVDRAPQALETAKRNFVLNGLMPAAHGFYCGDAIQHLRQAFAVGQHYDLVIADPPSFAPTERALPQALRAYRDLFALAINLVSPGGLLAAGSCSSHVDQSAFLSMLAAAALRAGRRMRVLEIFGQPIDHPTPPAFAEGRYLKFVIAQLD